ncbi:response regulator transcription factor [Sphingomonas sp. R86521]|uniref:response regulator transcription factor n=1 Tax=Sphingomonas sp. R86521 TaxID=3093860 RepID=UPI0036D29562
MITPQGTHRPRYDNALKKEMALTTSYAIAIVDDDSLVRSAVASLVRSFGFDVRSFASAVEYLEADTGEVACVLSDVHMPELSGVELQQRLRLRSNAPPVVLMTAFPGERLRATALSVGVLALIEKPVDSDRLLQLLESVLR